MSRLGEVRERDGVYEILMLTGSQGDIWEPLATRFVRDKLLEGPRESFTVTVAEALRAEGWIAPDEELPVCGARSRTPGLDARCLLREGHEGDHRDGGLRWAEGF